MKERLTGAIILVALIVLLVPELLTGPVRSAPRTAAAEAAAEGAPLRSYTIKLSDDSRTRAAEPQASGPEQPAPLPGGPDTTAPPAQPPAPAPAQTPAAGAHDTTPPPAAPAHPPSRPPAHAAAVAVPAAPGGAFVVQLGSFASRDNAERLAREVRARGFPVSVSQAATGRKLYRVRVGPTRDHAAAEELADKLRAAGHSGSVVPR